jgi:hypothetical protein
VDRALQGDGLIQARLRKCVAVQKYMYIKEPSLLLLLLLLVVVSLGGWFVVGEYARQTHVSLARLAG